MSAFRALLLLVLTLLGAACGGSSGSPARTPASKSTEIDLAQGEAPSESGKVSAGWSRPLVGGATSAQVPIDASDASWGSPTAPVTVVVFTDFQCPFCSRAHVTLTQLMQTYGPDKLRVVFKHNPLPFHQDAQPAAAAAQAVYELAGPEAFIAYAEQLFQGQRALTDANLLSWASSAGVERGKFIGRVGSPEVRAKIAADMDLAQRLGLSGTPSFMINGGRLVGAQPFEEFKTRVDAELAASRELRTQGVKDADVYSRRVAENYQAPEERPDSAADRPEPIDTTVWRVDVGRSPTQGAADALVTLVEFSDYQCPYCKKAQKTVDELLRRYSGKLRVVFKHQPLPFHQRALPAAILASEARAQKGDKAFWRATSLLFDRAPSLEDEDLLDIAKEMKLDVGRVKAALKKDSHKAAIQDDIDLADELDSRGTPGFFINGRKLGGAQPIEKFEQLIDEELGKAESLVRTGTPRKNVYAETMKGARTSGVQLEVAQVTPKHGKGNPSKGPANAPVTIQIFSDFQCPFCSRVLPTLEQVDKQYKGRVRFVWRNLPLPFHQDARPAAAAAMEAFAQKGSAGFWQMHDLLFANQKSLDRQSLEGYARKVGLAPDKFRDALDSGRHEAAIKADEGAAKAAGVSGTPGFVINGYYVSGAQPISRFKKVIRRALEDAKAGKKAAP